MMSTVLIWLLHVNWGDHFFLLAWVLNKAQLQAQLRDMVQKFQIRALSLACAMALLVIL